MPTPTDPARQLLPSPTAPADRAHPSPAPSPAAADRTRVPLPGLSRLAARVRRLLPPGLTGLAALACAACCAIPLLLTAGVLSGATWAVAVSWMPGIAAVLTVLAVAAWWRTTRQRHRSGCAGGACSCATP
ncbi:hypothetical protein ACWEOZ_09655 [Actinoplanes sp. NPDC004185]